MNLMTTSALAAVSGAAVASLLLTAWWVGSGRRTRLATRSSLPATRLAARHPALAAACRASTTILLILLTAALLGASVMTASNRAMGWVRTTDELWQTLTTPSQTGAVSVVPLSTVDQRVSQAIAAQPAVSGGSAGSTSITPATQPPDFTYRSDLGAWRAQVAGAASGITSSVTVWTPPGWSAQDGRSYDVVVLLHGYPGSDDGPLDALHVAQTVPELMASGAIRPTIVVVPYIRINGEEPDCLDLAGRPQVETFVVGDVVAAVRQAFPNVTTEPSGWLLAGVSSGGYCAPALALRHPDLFYGAVAMGGYDVPQLGGLAHADPAVRSQATISRMVLTASTPARLYVAASPADTDSVGLAQDVSAAARPGDRIAVDSSVSGGHSWAVWSQQLPGALRWWGQRDRDAAPASSSTGGSASDGTASSGTASVGAGAAGTGGAQSAGDQVATDTLSGQGRPVSLFSVRGAGTLAVSVLASVAALGACLLVGSRRARPQERGPSRSRLGRLRLAGPWLRRLVWGLGAYAARVGLVGMTALLLAATAGIAVNRSETFFASWTDLATNWATLF